MFSNRAGSSAMTSSSGLIERHTVRHVVPSCRARPATSIWAGIGTQITPLEWRMVKAISSGVAFGGREDDVALVLAVLVVDDDHGLAGGDVCDGTLDTVETDGLAHPATPSNSGVCSDVCSHGADARDHTTNPTTTNVA